MSSIPRIIIDQQMAEIGLKKTQQQISISQPHLEMSIETEPSQMEIERKNPSFKINRKKINSESGLKAPQEFSRDFRDKGKVSALRGSKTAVQDGNFLGETRIPGDRVGKLARNKTMSAVTKKQQINIEAMPKSRPEVSWDKGSMRINWSKHSIVIDWDGDYMPQVTIDQKSKIEIYLRTEPYFKVMVEQGDDPNMPGRFVDEAI